MTSARDPQSARVIIEVVGGVVPGTAMPELTRRWALTSAEWYGAYEKQGADAARRLLTERAAKADEYARELRDPARMNWVRTDWIWL